MVNITRYDVHQKVTILEFDLIQNVSREKSLNFYTYIHFHLLHEILTCICTTSDITNTFSGILICLITENTQHSTQPSIHVRNSINIPQQQCLFYLMNILTSFACTKSVVTYRKPEKMIRLGKTSPEISKHFLQVVLPRTIYNKLLF